MKTLKKLTTVFLFAASFTAAAQVGINTTSPDAGSILDISSSDKGVFIPRVDIADLSTIDPITDVGSSESELADAESLLVYNTNTTTGKGYYYWDGDEWVAMRRDNEELPKAQSVSLTTNEILAGSSYTAVPGMKLTFTAEKSEVMLNLTMSGVAYTNSLSYGSFRVYDTTTNTVLGGTTTNSQSIHESGSSTYTITTWSGAFSKLLTGLTVGQTYELELQVKTTNLYGTDGIAIFPDYYPDTNHATLSIQY
ncbi:hypothetical protein [Gilvibacter sediminis]|uniref:hypothetical protein n=1 Tax=Gilvibacter sediminis TaxID=379071 RepID=UPI0023503C1E|nr:hypothetical protein [Gilvibacter sediminis]MDC7997520.1 hypothetical protein [Gilvibacter sediminis]